MSPHWFKSTYSESNATCVEVAFLDDSTVGVRDSKNPTGPTLAFTPAAWAAFLDTAPRHGELPPGH